MAGSSFLFPLATATPTSAACPSANTTCRHRRRRLSCKATTSRTSSSSAGDDGLQARRVIVDRRDVLVGLTGVAAAAVTTTANLALAAATDTATTPACVTVPITDEFIRCVSTDSFRCPIEYRPEDVVEFSALPPAPSAVPLRVRRPAHLVAADAEYVRKYEAGIRMMKALDATDDPRSFKSQAAIHTAYCDFHYKVVSSAETDFDVHFSSVFAPWHRMYVYFFERIIGELVGDSSFALPYWNWDAPDGMAMPRIFADEASPLYDAKRSQAHVVDGVVMDLNLGPAASQSGLQACGSDDAACLKDTNLAILYRQMAVDTAGQFHGEKFCATSVKKPGTLENLAHTSVHIWMASESTGEDMGVLATAARDPIFYSHHCNVDRMWHLWTAALGHDDFTGATAADWLDTGFVFYDEKRRPVRIRVRDVLDASALGYAYEERENLEWLNKRPTPAAGVDRSEKKKPEPKVDPPATMSFPATLRKGEKQYATVERPAAARDEKRRKAQPEVLVVDVTVDPCAYAKFDVLVNVPRGQDALVGPQNSEFVGSFVNLPHGKRSGSGMRTLTLAYRFALRELIEDLKCGRDKTIDVTFVPVAGDMVVVDNVRVELL